MSRKSVVLRAVLTALAMLGVLVPASGAMAAQRGFVTTALHLRAGPGTNYPIVAVMTPGDPVRIHGCIRGYTWCDIDWRSYRGWASARYLQVLYRDRRAPIVRFGPSVGVPFIQFSIGTYWGNHYRHRDFYDRLPRYRHHRRHFDNPPPRPRFDNPPRWRGGDFGDHRRPRRVTQCGHLGQPPCPAPDYRQRDNGGNWSDGNSRPVPAFPSQRSRDNRYGDTPRSNRRTNAAPPCPRGQHQVGRFCYLGSGR